MVYRLQRILFVSLWFYYLPIIFVAVSNLAPVYFYWGKVEGCELYVENDCVGAGGVSKECEILCRAYAVDYEIISWN